MDQKTFEILIRSLAEPLRVALMALFILLSKMGWITWATPESMHGTVNAILDFLTVFAPTLYVIWVGFKSFRNKSAAAEAAKPVNIIAKAAALPQVSLIETTPEMANAIPDPTVVSGPPVFQPIN